MQNLLVLIAASWVTFAANPFGCLKQPDNILPNLTFVATNSQGQACFLAWDFDSSTWGTPVCLDSLFNDTCVPIGIVRAYDDKWSPMYGDIWLETPISNEQATLWLPPKNAFTVGASLPANNVSMSFNCTDFSILAQDENNGLVLGLGRNRMTGDYGLYQLRVQTIDKGMKGVWTRTDMEDELSKILTDTCAKALRTPVIVASVSDTGRTRIYCDQQIIIITGGIKPRFVSIEPSPYSLFELGIDYSAAIYPNNTFTCYWLQTPRMPPKPFNVNTLMLAGEYLWCGLYDLSSGTLQLSDNRFSMSGQWWTFEISPIPQGFTIKRLLLQVYRCTSENEE